MSRTRPSRHARLLPLAALGLVLIGAGPPQTFPDLVFVSRRPLSRDPGAGVPGLGPAQRAGTPGGRLMLRRADGRIAPFLHGGTFLDVQGPAVSWDGRRVAFAAATHPDSGWRIWVADADGRNLRRVTRTEPAAGAPTRRSVRPRRIDDLDPCWLPDGRLCFASTRYPQRGEAGGAVTNLFVVDSGGGGLMRITGERNGAEKPSVDPVSGRVLFARWWTNRYRASDLDPTGITLDSAKALPGERVSLWHAVTVGTDGDGIRLAGGYPRVRAEMMAYDPILLADGTLVGVGADTLPLIPHPGRVHLVVYPGGFAEPIAFPASPARMCAPAALPDGRLVAAYDSSGRGDFGLAVVNRDGTGLTPLVDLRGTLELDPAVLVRRPLPPVLDANAPGMPRVRPATERAEVDRAGPTVRFDCLNVFANGPVDFPVPDAPPVARDVRIRFFASLARPAAPAGDTVVFLRDAPVNRSGAIHVDDAPADLPMFEQLVDAKGHVLRSASGPAHVPGFNAGRSGSGTKCVGCHVGHSAIPVADSYAMGKRFNAAPSASVTATSEAAGTGARALVDRRTRGPARDVAWVARTTSGEAVTLRWPFALALDTLVVYAIRPDPGSATDLSVGGCDIRLLRGGRLLRRLRLVGGISPSGTAIGCGGRLVDAVEFRPGTARGRVEGTARTGLAEVEARVRIPED